MSTSQKEKLIGRRAELMAELFLQDLEPEYVAQATDEDFGYDFLVGFANKQGGTNTYAVQVKATEQPVNDKCRLPRHLFDRLAHSNIPVLLLVVDVKRNSLFYAWPRDEPKAKSRTGLVSVAVQRVDEVSKAALRNRMAG